MSDTHPGITEIYIDLPVGITDATTGEARKVVGYMCNDCRRASLNGSFLGEQGAKGPVYHCCWCEKHQARKPKVPDGTPRLCAGCKIEQEARNNEARWKREADELARAIPLTPDMAGFFDDEDLYSDAGDYFEAYSNRVYPDGIDPNWIPIVREAEPAGPDTFFDASDLIEYANDRAEVDDEHPDCLVQKTAEAVAELQYVLDEWVAKHGPKGEWYTAGRLVRLDAELKLWLAENPDAVAKGIDENDEDETATQGAQE